MTRSQKQPRIIQSTPLKELQPAPANPPIYTSMSVPIPQVSQLTSHQQNNELVNNSWSHLTLTALKKEYTKYLCAETMFPPDLNDNNIQSSILQYQSYMDSIIEGLKCICRCCKLFISVQELQLFVRNDFFIYNAIISVLLVISNVDSYSIFTNSTHLCTICYRSLLCKNRSKFGTLNSFACIECQSYPFILADLSMAKEVTITCACPVVSILKLRLSGAFNLTIYTCIKGHAILFPQNLVFLLNLLSSPTLALYDVIRIVQVSQECPTNFDL